jgi:outer membrane protein assembly factor BamA
MLPRFWSPYATFGDETRFGAVTGGVDPLFRHAYGVELFRGSETGRLGFRGLYQYDRLRPTLLAVWEDVTDPLADGGRLRTQEGTLRATLPVLRRIRHSQSLSVAYRRRVERVSESLQAGRLDLGAVETSWSFSSARSFPFSISPVEGVRARVAYAQEAEALGSELSLGKLSADLRAYTRVFGTTDALALRLGGGTSFGEPEFQRSYAVGGFPDRGLLDVAFTNEAVLRGYPDDAFSGRSFVSANAEYRFPLGHPQRGFWSFPVFLRHVHAAVFADAASAWSGSFRIDGVKPGVGAAIGADLILGHGLFVTTTAGVAHGFAARGETRAYFRTGLAF